MERSDMSKPMRVCLVEDHAEIREAVASEFEPEPDFEIVGQAASLAEAHEILASTDVVILDRGLPDGSGLELMPELRDGNPEARAIVLSATYDPALHARAVEHRAAAVLDKLTYLGQVAQAVRQLRLGSDCCCQSRTSAELNRACWSPADFSLGTRSDERLTRPPQRPLTVIVFWVWR
jgi:two-component system response regulator DevR